MLSMYRRCKVLAIAVLLVPAVSGASLSVGLDSPKSELFTFNGNQFVMNATATCKNGDCGLVNGTARFNSSGTEPDRAMESGLEVLKPTDYNDTAGNTTSPGEAFDFETYDGTTASETNATADDPSIVWYSWESKTRSYSNLSLSVTFSGSGFSDDDWYIAYENESGATCNSTSSKLADTSGSLVDKNADKQNQTVSLPAGQDLGKLDVCLGFSTTLTGDDGTVRVYDIRTEGTPKPFHTDQKKNPLTCDSYLAQGETCNVTWDINVTGDPGTYWSVDVNFTTNSSVASTDTNNSKVCIGCGEHFRGGAEQKVSTVIDTSTSSSFDETLLQTGDISTVTADTGSFLFLSSVTAGIQGSVRDGFSPLQKLSQAVSAVDTISKGLDAASRVTQAFQVSGEALEWYSTQAFETGGISFSAFVNPGAAFRSSSSQDIFPDTSVDGGYLAYTGLNQGINPATGLDEGYSASEKPGQAFALEAFPFDSFRPVDSGRQGLSVSGSPTGFFHASETGLQDIPISTGMAQRVFYTSLVDQSIGADAGPQPGTSYLDTLFQDAVTSDGATSSFHASEAGLQDIPFSTGMVPRAFYNGPVEQSIAAGTDLRSNTSYLDSIFQGADTGSGVTGDLKASESLVLTGDVSGTVSHVAGYTQDATGTGILSTAAGLSFSPYGPVMQAASVRSTSIGSASILDSATQLVSLGVEYSASKGEHFRFGVFQTLQLTYDLIDAVTEETDDSGTSSSDDGETSSGSLGGGLTFGPELEVEPGEMVVKLEPGGKTVRRVNVSNSGSSKASVDAEVEGLDDFVSLAAKNFTVEPGEVASLPVFVTVPESMDTGVREGYVMLESSSETFEVPVNIVVEAPEEELLDVRLDLEKYEFNPGERKNYRIEIFNMGTEERVDIFLNHTVRRDGEVVVSRVETLAARTSVSVSRNIDRRLEPGNYTLSTVAYYSNKTAKSATSFEVTEKATLAEKVSDLVPEEEVREAASFLANAVEAAGKSPLVPLAAGFLLALIVLAAYRKGYGESYHCSYCGESFEDEDHFIIHVSNHKAVDDVRSELEDEPEEFTCGECGESFDNQESLHMHKVSAHSDSEEHVCDECGESFDSQESLHMHTISKHSNEHECEYCGEVFESENALNGHKGQKHPDEKYVCDVCGEKFNNRRGVASHKSQVHQGSDSLLERFFDRIGELF